MFDGVVDICYLNFFLLLWDDWANKFKWFFFALLLPIYLQYFIENVLPKYLTRVNFG